MKRTRDGAVEEWDLGSGPFDLHDFLAFIFIFFSVLFYQPPSLLIVLWPLSFPYVLPLVLTASPPAPFHFPSLSISILACTLTSKSLVNLNLGFCLDCQGLLSECIACSMFLDKHC